MSLIELAHILKYSGGITEEGSRLRASPSAGATYPIEINAVVNNVEGLAKGVYHYLISSHKLELLREGDLSNEISRGAMQGDMLNQVNVIIALCAVFHRITGRYGERAQRYIFIESGHIAQNTYLLATSMGMGACAIGAFYKDEFNRLLGLDGTNESVIYLMAVGKI